MPYIDEEISRSRASLMTNNNAKEKIGNQFVGFNGIVNDRAVDGSV